MWQLRLRLLLSVCLLGLGTSCIEFDGQTTTFRYDAEQDELRIFQVYQRIHADGEQGRLTDAERKQLATVVGGQRTFFFANWITDYSREATRNEIEKLRQQLAAAEPADREPIQAQLDFRQELQRSVDVVNGHFFLNQQQQLCGYQQVVVRNVTRLLELASRWIRLAVEADALEGYDDAARQAIRQFIADGGNWIELDGNQLTIRYFTTPEQYAVQEKSQRLFTADGKPAFAGKLAYDAPFAVLTIGSPDAAMTTLQVDNLRNGSYNSLVLDEVRQKHDVLERLNLDRIRDDFLKSAD